MYVEIIFGVVYVSSCSIKDSSKEVWNVYSTLINIDTRKTLHKFILLILSLVRTESVKQGQLNDPPINFVGMYVPLSH